jgi:hypothetical protein
MSPTPAHLVPVRGCLTALRRTGRQGLPVVLALTLAACVFSPRTIQVYDPKCQITSRQMVLEAGQASGMIRCRGEECAAMLVAMGVVSAATAVVSGSIVLVGNVVYWFEKQGQQCRPPIPGQG